MHVRSRVILAAVAALALAVPSVAHGSTGPKRLQLLAMAQTELMFANLTQPQQVASPARCDQGQPSFGILGEFFLPMDSFNAGDATFDCRIRARTVVLDLGGALASEDASGDTWTLANGTKLTFTRGNLERICDDVLRVFPASAPATLDGAPIAGTQVSTPAIPVLVHRGAPDPLFQDSVDLHHPGVLAASSCGWKAELRLRPGRHVINVDLTDSAGAPTHFTYNIVVL